MVVMLRLLNGGSQMTFKCPKCGSMDTDVDGVSPEREAAL